ncbi:hypothetical protein E4U30_002994 [Claviceps sp. LM220 group G6]|nr:hypothetical protein E4U30_002994 [Claviceps sp. LM220 group G6]
MATVPAATQAREPRVFRKRHGSLMDVIGCAIGVEPGSRPQSTKLTDNRISFLSCTILPFTDELTAEHHNCHLDTVLLSARTRLKRSPMRASELHHPHVVEV